MSQLFLILSVLILNTLFCSQNMFAADSTTKTDSASGQNKDGSDIISIIKIPMDSSKYIIPRRKDQFNTNPSYLIMPLPYSYPGIGQGIMLLGLAGNIAETNMDFFGLQAFGDVQGTFMGFDDLHILPETLIFSAFGQNFDKIGMNNYKNRGMNNSRHDYSIMEMRNGRAIDASLTLSLFKRRLEFAAGYSQFQSSVTKIRDSKGDVTVSLEKPQKSKNINYSFAIRGDLTDDNADPRKGLRVNLDWNKSPPSSSDSPNYYTVTSTTNGYIPLGEASTLAFVYLHSDAFVTAKGEVDESVIRSNTGIDCDEDDSECLETQDDMVAQDLAANKKGTANSLGGINHLRSFPSDRYRAAHARMFGAEYRWNISERIRPFNFWIWKDVAAALQTAFFAEIGTVAENESDLYKEKRSSVGVGFRMISQTGFVYRADFATGDEGNSFIMLFSYPW